MQLRDLATKAIDLLYPERCVDCGAFGALLCEACESGMEPATGPGRCPHCSARWDGSANCPRCFELQDVDGVRAAFEMNGAARQAVHALKYRGVRALGGYMARHLAPLRESQPFDAAFVVPLHSRRERSRGFNQSEVLLQATGWPGGAGRLRRVRNTRTQVGMHLGERRINVSGAFAYEGPALAGLTVALLDDVVTTGSTVNECAAVLREHGARHVYAFAFARASYNAASPTAAIDD